MKLKVGVLFGGVSSEHEVSLRSAASVIRALDVQRFECIPIGINKRGEWFAFEVQQLRYDAVDAIILEETQGTLLLSFAQLKAVMDVAFPALHGTYVEDGCLQGFLETLQIPYVGATVLGSAIAMDKVVSKTLAQARGFLTPRFLAISLGEWQKDKMQVQSRVLELFTLPCFVKPNSTGSSVGIHKAKTQAALWAAIEDAFRYDEKVLVEEAINAREIEVSVLEASHLSELPLASLPGEIIPTHEFYDYAAKYLDPNGARLCIPAELSKELIEEVQTMAAQLFNILNLQGMARMDFFLEKTTNRLLFNEANTLPGFTSISMYPKLWQVSGLNYTDLLTQLVERALARAERALALTRQCEF